MIDIDKVKELYNNYPIDLLEDMLIDAAKHHQDRVQIGWNDTDKQGRPTLLQDKFKAAWEYFSSKGFICNRLDYVRPSGADPDEYPEHLTIISFRA